MITTAQKFGSGSSVNKFFWDIVRICFRFGGKNLVIKISHNEWFEHEHLVRPVWLTFDNFKNFSAVLGNFFTDYNFNNDVFQNIIKKLSFFQSFIKICRFRTGRWRGLAAYRYYIVIQLEALAGIMDAPRLFSHSLHHESQRILRLAPLLSKSFKTVHLGTWVFNGVWFRFRKNSKIDANMINSTQLCVTCVFVTIPWFLLQISTKRIWEKLSIF